ncbi:MAG: PD-(D/E)XK nuclease family protein [Pseudomonadota bacterium]
MDAVSRPLSDDRLFAPESPRLWTVPAGVPFLAAVANALANAVDLTNHPDALAEGVIYVPNRRSARALALALHQAAGPDATLLMPQIRALGDLETDDAPPGVDAAFADLGPALPEAKRLGALVKLVMAWFQARDIAVPPNAALSSARELASLLDAAAIAGDVDWSSLPSLVEHADLAAHWAQSIEFLSIITHAWPAWLEDQSALDPLVRRLVAAQTIANTWGADPPHAPVLIAGSTGATPASRILMGAALNLEKGAVILPGVDGALSPEEATAIEDEPSHPQHALVRTLSRFAVKASDVPALPGSENKALAERRAFIHESLSPAALTGDWRDRLSRLSKSATPGDFTAAALDGLDIVACRDETEEALSAACLLRSALEIPGQTAALVCPDPGLSRRVSAHLSRWGLSVAPSEGTPLTRTHAGTSFDALLNWWCAPADPVAIAALLRAPHCIHLPGAEAFERWILRGVVWWDDLPGLVDGLRNRLNDARFRDRPGGETCDVIEAVAHRLLGLAEAFGPPGPIGLEPFRDVLRSALPRIFDTERLWRSSDGAALAQLMETLGHIGQPIGPLPPSDWLILTRSLARDIMVAPTTPAHPRLSIWGSLEARLQSADHLILAGLNEDIWPRRPGADTFLPRKLQVKLGLEDPETRMGLAAHDFAGLACARRVTLMYSERRDDAPAVASRWVWRLQTLVRGALGDDADSALSPSPGRDPRQWATALRDPLLDQPPEHAIPRPTPPAEARPTRLSVTRIDTLQRDPYAIYAERVLRLAPLAPLAKPIDARETGTAIHRALELFDPKPGLGADGLLDLMEIELRWHGEPRESLAGRRAILRNIATWYVDWHTSRQIGLEGGPYLEVKGTLTFPRPGLPDFTLSAVADRIERRIGGDLAVLDFKTGNPPSDKEIAAGLSQQMPLQGLIASIGGFEGVAAGDVSELTYVAVKAKPDVRVIGTGRNLNASAMELAEDAHNGLTKLIAAFSDADRPYLSAPRAQFVKYEGDYGRLARRAEWTSEIGDD